MFLEYIHKQPADSRYDANFWLCAATIDEDVRIKGQENAYKEVIKTAIGGAAGVIKAVASATTDCQPNDNVEALRVFMLQKKVECRPVWKPMHKQPVYADAVVYTNGVSEEIFKVGFCLPAGPYVSDDDVKYIVEKYQRSNYQIINNIRQNTIMSIFADKTLMITGGTGSFGNAVLNRFLCTDIAEIRIFSRDEKKQDDMRHEYQVKMPEVARKN